MDPSVPRDLIFDDEPLKAILYGENYQEATLVDIFERWRGCNDLEPESLDTVAAILGLNPKRGKNLDYRLLARIVERKEQSLMTAGKQRNPREQLKLANIYQAAGLSERAENCYRQVLENSDAFDPLPKVNRWQAMSNLAALLEQMGRKEEAEAEQMILEGEQLLADDTIWAVNNIRALGLALFTKGRFKAAEQMYRGLLEQQFEQPGTLTHLARVLLMQDRLQEAQQAIADAEKLMRTKKVRDETSEYVLHRILFFRILFAMLARESYTGQLDRLKTKLQKDLYRMQWTIEPVITHLQPYLRPDDLNVLTAMAAAINSAEDIDKLNALPE